MTAHGHGKLILLGEHAVVYGARALAVGLGRGIQIERSPAADREWSVLSVEPWGVEVRVRAGRPHADDAESSLVVALAAVLEAAGQVESVSLRARAELPAGAGLGSSAALGVALARALSPAASVEAVERVANVFEGVFHGNASGLDVAVAARGGCIAFRRGEPVRSLSLRRPLRLCVGSSGTASSTRAMVDGVAALRARRPEATDKSIAAIDSLVQNAHFALESDDLRGLGRLLDMNQLLLAGLFVSTPALEELCRLARGAGALGAKLTGAGGGGSVVALVDDPEPVLQAWRGAGYDGFFTEVSP